MHHLLRNQLREDVMITVEISERAQEKICELQQQQQNKVARIVFNGLG